MAFSLQNAEFEINCPNCSKAIKVRFRDVGNSVICPRCKQEIHLQDADFSKNARKAEQEISNFVKRINAR